MRGCICLQNSLRFQKCFVFLSFASPKERNKEKETTKTNSNFFFHTVSAFACLKKLQFALFVDGQRTLLIILILRNCRVFATTLVLFSNNGKRRQMRLHMENNKPHSVF